MTIDHPAMLMFVGRLCIYISTLMTFKYTPYYCEENIWYLCQGRQFEEFEKYVLIISNQYGGCEFRNQKLCLSPNHSVCWDYHVILIYREFHWLVWDLDSTLHMPATLNFYLESTFRNDTIDAGEHPPAMQFRPLTAEKYIKKFSSDRLHMRNERGDWLQPPPPWPPIIRDSGLTLSQLTDMTSDCAGSILTIQQLRDKFDSNGD